MSLTTNSTTQNLFFKSEKKREFSDVLNEVQSYISSKYSALVIDGINNVNSGNDEVKIRSSGTSESTFWTTEFPLRECHRRSS